MMPAPDEYWQEEVVGGLLDISRDTQAELFWHLHSQEELYEEGPLEDLGLYLSRSLAIFNYAAKGQRIYLHAKPFIWKPRIILTMVVSEEPDLAVHEESNVPQEIGRVISSDVADYERFYLGMAQAYYYPVDQALVLWECDVFHLTKHTEEDLGEGAFYVTLWQRFESMLRERFPATKLIVTPGWDPGYSSEEWRAFLARQGYAPDTKHERTFMKLLVTA
ncbi:MAG: hypothetical protein WCB68_01840 [Pyrinomonadaceae bacterium]